MAVTSSQNSRFNARIRRVHTLAFPVYSDAESPPSGSSIAQLGSSGSRLPASFAFYQHAQCTANMYRQESLRCHRLVVIMTIHLSIPALSKAQTPYLTSPVGREEIRSMNWVHELGQ